MRRLIGGYKVEQKEPQIKHSNFFDNFFGTKVVITSFNNVEEGFKLFDSVGMDESKTKLVQDYLHPIGRVVGIEKPVSGRTRCTVQLF
jgi:hypothetical protein